MEVPLARSSKCGLQTENVIHKCDVVRDVGITVKVIGGLVGIVALYYSRIGSSSPVIGLPRFLVKRSLSLPPYLLLNP